LVDGVLAFEDVPLRGLDKRKRSGIPYLKKWSFHKDSSRNVKPAASDWQQTGGFIIRFLVHTGGFAVCHHFQISSTVHPATFAMCTESPSH